VPRIDKTDSETGVHRGTLAADWAAAAGVPIGVGLDVNGLVVPGAGQTGVIGITIRNTSRYPGNKAGDRVDVFNHAELAEFGGVAGTLYYADNTTGALGTTGGTGKTLVGHTMEADRLVVHCG
jgi:hypothetical protein